MKKFLPLAVLTLCCLLVVGVSACSSTADTSTTTSGQTATTASGGTATTTGQTGTTAAPGTALWTELKPSGDGPSVRAGQCMVYDAKNDQVIMFGGTDSTALFADTWAYSPSVNAWKNLNPSGQVPSGRAAMAMVYDPASGKVVMFGGIEKNALLGDTWIYDPGTNAWTEVTTTGAGPSARGGHAMVYEPATGKVLLFGGKDDSGVLNDTWTFDVATTTWTRLEPANGSPTARYGHAMTVEDATGKVLVFGGWDSKKYFDSTWVYDPVANSWTSLDTQGLLPAKRAGHCLVYDPATGGVIMFGGTSGSSFLRDVIYFDPTTSTWTTAETGSPWPVARNGHSMVYDSASNVLILFGGWDGKTYFNDLWSLAG
jgi:N-acetylneuraminic acid mutarotase